MEIAKKVGAVLGILFVFAGCAMGQPVQQGSGQGSPLERSQAARNEEAERWKAMEAALSSLRSEVERLRGEIGDLNTRMRNLQVRPPIASFKPPAEISLCGERVPIEDRKVWENLDREFLMAINNEAQVLLWMKRARRYFPTIERRLREMGLPDDLKYVTITESSLRPLAISSSGAAGIWQFIPPTGEKYGMRKSKGFDERFDFLKATDGALTYLKSLYEEFGKWALSMAAYNAGENRIRKEVELQKTADYYRLLLPAETERYVYKIAVAKIVLSDPGRYGFHLEERDLYDPLELERIQIELARPLSLVEVARAVGVYYKDIKEINPHLSDENVPAGIHSLNLPRGKIGRAHV